MLPWEMKEMGMGLTFGQQVGKRKTIAVFSFRAKQI